MTGAISTIYKKEDILGCNLSFHRWLSGVLSSITVSYAFPDEENELLDLVKSWGSPVIRLPDLNTE